MAFLITPQNQRVYNPNARGAVTTIVKMKAHNPFESEQVMVTKPAMATRGQLAGLGFNVASFSRSMASRAVAPAPTSRWGSMAFRGLRGLGDTPAEMQPDTGATPAPAADTSSIDWAALAQKGVSIGSGVIQNLLVKPAAPPAPRVVAAPGMSTTTKVLLIGGIAAAGILAFVMLKK